MGDGHMFAGVGRGGCEPLALDVLNTVANGWGTKAVLGVDRWLLGVWLGGVWEGVTHHERHHAHVRLLRHMPPHRGEGRLCMFSRAGGGSGPHGEEQGTAMFKKCAQRGLASCGLELYCYIWSCWFSPKGCMGSRAVGVYGKGNS